METTLLALVAMGLGLWLWRDSLRARESATAICKRACAGEDLQLLDDTVALVRLRPVLLRGQPRLRRVYGFEFSRDGTDRLHGSITMLGPYMESLHMDNPASEPPPAVPSNVISLRRLRH